MIDCYHVIGTSLGRVCVKMVCLELVSSYVTACISVVVKVC